MENIKKPEKYHKSEAIRKLVEVTNRMNNPKQKALHKKVKATGGTLTFMTKHHPEQKKHEAHEKEKESRKGEFRKFLGIK